MDRSRTFYTGITNNLEKRVKAHNSGKGAKFTRGRTWSVKASWPYPNRSEASKAEAKFKKLRRSAKEYYATYPSLWGVV